MTTEQTDRVDIVDRLRSLARAEHMDLSVGDEAADVIERARRLLHLAMAQLRRGVKFAEKHHGIGTPAADPGREG